jgi:hypothetical protein
VPDYYYDQSRVDKFKKRRKNTKLINILIVFGSALALVLIFLVFFNDDDKQASTSPEDTTPEEETTDSLDSNQAEETDENNENVDPSNEDIEQEDNIGETEEKDEETKEQIIEGSTEGNDPNVLQTIIKDWNPIGTVQSEPHVAVYSSDSVDWREMWDAAYYATGLSQDTSIQWYAQNGGSHNHAIITISDKQETNNYRVYLEWVTNEGWKPTKVEVLKENDKKDLFSSSENENIEETTQISAEISTPATTE